MTTSGPRRALVATHSLIDYAGAEVFTLELAIELRGLGWDVLIATILSGEPMISEFRKHQFQVIDLLHANPAIDGSHFDLAWVHHTPVFNELFLARKIRATSVVFCSLSHFEPLEKVPACTDRIDLLLAHSDENKEVITSDLGLDEDEVIVFPNAVPSVFWSDPKKSHSRVLTRLAIISNHPPDEILNAAEVLRKQGLHVTRFGLGGTRTLMLPNVLLDFDAVITVGKTVPYCFALKVPVYCYDSFGGPGWLSVDNLIPAAQKNFSGRGFTKKTHEEIAQEIVRGYQSSLLSVERLRDHAASHQDLRRNLAVLLTRPRTFAQRPPAGEKSAQASWQHAQYMGLASALSVTRGAYDVKLEACEDEISRIKTSRSWRLTAPFRVAYNAFRRIWRAQTNKRV